MSLCPPGVEWQFAEPQPWGIAWGGFDAQASSQLEQAFTHGQASLNITSSNGFTYVVDFNDMQQTNQRTQRTRVIKRYTETTLVPPGEAWEQAGLRGNWIELDTSTCEHLRIRGAAGIDSVPVQLETPQGLQAWVFTRSSMTMRKQGASVPTSRTIRINAARCLPVNTYALQAPATVLHAPHATVGGGGDPQSHAQEAARATDCTAEVAEDETCAICLDAFEHTPSSKRALRLRLCGPGHYMHRDCIIKVFGALGSKCPTCGIIYAAMEGTQPPGTMHVSHSSKRCSGYTVGTIVIDYHFPSGVQSQKHPSPGAPYTGTSRRAYLPDVPEGREVLTLLQRSFDQKLTFTVGTSITTGCSNAVIWNGIHHKTSFHGGAQAFGWPDATYFQRVKQELSAKGIA